MVLYVSLFILAQRFLSVHHNLFTALQNLDGKLLFKCMPGFITVLSGSMSKAFKLVFLLFCSCVFSNVEDVHRHKDTQCKRHSNKYTHTAAWRPAAECQVFVVNSQGKKSQLCLKDELWQKGRSTDIHLTLNMCKLVCSQIHA